MYFFLWFIEGKVCYKFDVDFKDCLFEDFSVDLVKGLFQIYKEEASFVDSFPFIFVD
jgi:hypothetical protein